MKGLTNNHDPSLAFVLKKKSRFGLALLKALSELQGKLHEVVFPLLILHGDDDRLCDISGSDLLNTMSTSKDKTYSVSSSEQ